MSNQYPAQEFLVGWVGESPDDVTNLGRIRLDSDGTLRAIASTPGHEQRLADIVDQLNAKESIFQKSVPPESAAPLEIFMTEVKRVDPGFPDAIKAYAESYLGVQLLRLGELDEGAAEAAAPEPDLEDLLDGIDNEPEMPYGDLQIELPDDLEP